MKRTLSLLLVAAMLLAIPVMPVSAQPATYENNVTPLTDACPCGCGKTLDEVEWMPWNPMIKGSPADGHHYLTADYVQESDAYSLIIIAGTKVVLDLRGFTWSTKAAFRTMTVQGDFYLMDTVGGGKFAPLTDKTWGGAVLVDTYETANPSFTLCSGTMTMAKNSTTASGGLVYAREDGRFVMTGGVIEDCTVSGGGGAVVTQNSATVEILGGVFRNCSAGQYGGAIRSIQPVKLENCTFINCTAGTSTGGAVSTTKAVNAKNVSFIGCSAGGNGGAVYAGGGLKAENVTFIGNYTTSNSADDNENGKVDNSNGGAVYASGTSNLSGCEFIGNYTTGDAEYSNGGSIYTGGTMTMTNTTFTGGTSQKWGGQIYLDAGTLNATGCTFNGGSSVWTDTVYGGGGNIFAYRGNTTLTNCTLKNGFATNYGGNLGMSASATVTLNNTTVSGGVCQRYGNNIGAQGVVTMTINGGEIKGDVHLPSGCTTTLKGQLKIGMTNLGIQVGKDANVDASGLTAGSEIYINGTGSVVKAGANKDYFRGAIRTELSGGDGAAITGTAGTTGYCPHCLEKVTWSAYNNEKDGGHYYLSANLSSIAPTSGTTVIDLNGKTVSSASARAVTISAATDANIQVALLDSAGLAQVTGNGGSATAGGGVVINNGLLKIYGGTYKVTGAKTTFGGVINNRGTLETYGGVFDGSAYNNTASATGTGGAVYVLANKALTVQAGRFIGGTAYNGGNIWVGAGTTTDITGGTFVDGTATNSGGNIFFAGAAATGSANVENAVITGGSAGTSESSLSNGGNLKLGQYATNTVTNCYIANGTATGSGSYAGNVSGSSSNATVADCVIYGGTAYNGGNVYTATLTSAITLDSCRIMGGTATNNGGNIMFNHGNNTIKGGELSYGTARIGGNMYAHAGNHASGGKTIVIKNDNGKVPLFLGGTASYGGNLTVAGVLELTDAQFLCGRTIAVKGGRDIQMTDGGVQTQLTVGSGVTGDICMVASSFIASPLYGQPITGTVCNTLNANIVLESAEGMPSILKKNGQLYVSGAQLVDEKGNVTWCADYAAAEAACADGEYVKLFTDAELKLTKDTYVDLNGKTVTVADTSTGKLLGMDTTGDSYADPAGKVTFTGASPVADKSIVYAPNGNKYVALVGDGAVTYHRLGADLTSVTINIDKNAVYFKGTFGADPTLKPLIDTYGIAVSLNGVPNEQGIEDSLKTTHAGADMAIGDVTKGVYITNILKDTLSASENNTRGRDEIYATAYVTLTDGTTTFISDQSSTAEDDVAWSLYDAFNRLDELIDEDPTIFRRYTNNMRDYYAQWKDKGIADWTRQNTNFVEPDRDDGVIDVLMIGSSACYYYVEEMAALALAKGIKMRVCNVYYSGCPIQKYYDDWNNNYADYQFFDTTAEWVDGEIVATRRNRGGGRSLEWCLAQGNWDVISMQTRGALALRDYFKGIDHLKALDIKEASEFMFRYVANQFPNADFYLNEFKASQRGSSSTYGGVKYDIDTLDKQTLYAVVLKKTAERMAEKFADIEMGVMRQGQAFQIVREAGYDDLCARIGFVYDAAPNGDPNQGDHGHDGDIGGGQYLTGAVWLQTIMMNIDEELGGDPNFDVRGITWEPDYYDKNGDKVDNRFDVQLLLDSAYEAVTMGWEPAEDWDPTSAWTPPAGWTDPLA